MMIAGGLGLLVAVLSVLMMMGVVPMNPITVGGGFLILVVGNIAPWYWRERP